MTSGHTQRRARVEWGEPGDRVIYEGIGKRRGRSGDLVLTQRDFGHVRFNDGHTVLVPTRDLIIIPRRPEPEF